MNKYDVLIIGGACAGLSAAIYSARRTLKTLVITKDIGGQIATTTEVENYPGTGTIMGPALAEAFRKQAEASGAEILFGEVSDIKKINDDFILETSKGQFIAPVVILSFGLEHRKLNIPGEKEYTGKGVGYCATCDGPLFKDKVIGVVGGGNSAFDAAEHLSKIGSKVYLFVRTDRYKAEKVLIELVTKSPNIEIMKFTEIKEILGDKFLKQVKVENNRTKEISAIDLNALFIEVGWVAKTDFVKDMVDLNERGFIIVNNKNETSLPGLYAAGDVTDTPFKQAVISAGEGAKAAIAAGQYLQQVKGLQISSSPQLSRKK